MSRAPRHAQQPSSAEHNRVSPRGTVLRSLSLFTALMVFWLLLSGKYDLSHGEDRFLTGCGVASCGFVTWLSTRKMSIADHEGHPIQFARRAPSYAVWLLWQIVLSNWDVFKRVWSREMPIDPCVVDITYTLETEFCAALYANSITLTPGTVTMDVDLEKRTMKIHCLTRGVGDDLTAGGMQARVHQFESGSA